MTEEEIFRNLRNNLKQIFYNAIICNKDVNFAMYEGQDSFRQSIEEIYFDVKKMSKISSEIFDKNILPELKRNRFGEKGNSVELLKLYKDFPELRGILKELDIYIDLGDQEGELGSIKCLIDDLSKFEITLFVKSICYIMTDKEFSSIRSLTKSELSDLKIGFIRVLIHELNHLRNYFLKQHETLLRDFTKFYSFSNFERQAFFNEFFYQFLMENGINIIKNLDEDTFLSKVKQMRCWKKGLELDYFGKNKVLFDNFLKNLYNFFKNKKIKFGEEKIFDPRVPFITTVEDIRNIQIPPDLIDEISQVPDLDDDESKT